MKQYFILFISIFLFFECTKVQDWSDSKDEVAPGSVSNPKVENLNGGARITYQRPSDTDLLGVKARYKYDEEDHFREIFSSIYRDTIEIFGFPNTNERTISLLSVDKSGNESDPIEIKIKPLTPPVELIKNSITAKETYGGIYVTWINDENSNISVSVFTTDSTGKLNLDGTFYSKLQEDSYSFRGYDDTEKEFVIQVKDRWGNTSQTDTVLTPLFEEEIVPYDEKGQMIFSRFSWSDGASLWRGETSKDKASSEGWANAFDGITLGGKPYWGSGNNLLNTFNSSFPKSQIVFPIYTIFDLKEEVTLSRIIIWGRGVDSDAPKYYQVGNPKRLEVWGTDETPKGGPRDFETMDESLVYWTDWPLIGGEGLWRNDWFQIIEGEALPPSGAKNYTEITEEDRLFADKGFQFEVPPEIGNKKVRYIRLVVNEIWELGRDHFQIMEIKIYGAYVNKQPTSE